MELIFNKTTKNKMKPIGELLTKSLEETFKSTVTFRNRREELIYRLTKGINAKREGTKYNPLSVRTVAIKANKNPFLKSDDELELIISDCEKHGSYSKFFWVCK